MNTNYEAHTIYIALELKLYFQIALYF